MYVTCMVEKNLSIVLHPCETGVGRLVVYKNTSLIIYIMTVKRRPLFPKI
jgi:hypothetical protein